MKSICIIDPYYAYSHQHWADALADNLCAKINIISRPPLHWKWRMEGAAIDIAKEVNSLKNVPDVFIATDYLNLGLFKSLLHPRFLKSRFVIYMHENQLTYPISSDDTDQIKNRDNHYGFINYTSCLVADYILFNSHYHRSVFFNGIKILSNKLPDQLDIETIVAKSDIAYPTISINSLKLGAKHSPTAPTILWNHRWDYDKRPEVFLDALIELKKRSCDFKLMLLGNIDDNTANEYKSQLDFLQSNLVSIGYAKSKLDYIKLIGQCDISISTSIHDFFGISVVESICVGCRPVLPHDLAYPELIDPSLHDQVFYNRSNLVEHLIGIINQPWSVRNQETLRAHIENNFTWEKVAPTYNRVLGIV